MAIVFPSSPTNGQVFSDPVTGNRYTYDSSKSLWKFSSNNVSMTVGVAPPPTTTVAPGAMWYNTNTGRTFILYDDGDSRQWVENVPAVGSFDSSTVAGYANAAVLPAVTPAYNTANAGYVVANAAFSKANTALANTSGVSFNGNFYVPSGNVGIGVTSPSHRLHVSGTGFASSDFRAPIFYDSENTSFYVDPASTTQLNTVGISGTLSMTGFIVGRTGNGGGVGTANDGGSMSVRGDSANAASISFHRPGAYAMNMGLDTDNIFRIGGWSDGASSYRLTLGTPGGSHTLNGNLNVTGSSIASSGYTRLVNGVIVQWGSQTVGPDRSVDYNFPITFPSGCYGFGVSGDWQDANGWISAGGRPISSSQYRLYNVLPGNIGVWWIAIGY